MLPGDDETLDEVVNGVWNLSGEQGHLGAFHITSLRIIWQSLMNDVFNMSLPFLQVQNITKQESKYGRALVLHCTARAGGYTLGFRVDPPEAFDRCLMKLQQLWRLALMKPRFGIVVESLAPEDKVRLADSCFSLMSMSSQVFVHIDAGGAQVHLTVGPTGRHQDCG